MASKRPASSSTGGKNGKSRLETSVSRCVSRGEQPQVSAAAPWLLVHPVGVPARFEASRGWMLSWLRGRDSPLYFGKEGRQTGRGKRLRKKNGCREGRHQNLASVGKAPACWVTRGHSILWRGCHNPKGLNCFSLSSVGSFARGDSKPPLCSRTIKEKRDAYVRRLNEIYENNIKKVRTCLSCEPRGEAGSAGFLAPFPAVTGALFS